MYIISFTPSHVLSLFGVYSKINVNSSFWKVLLWFYVGSHWKTIEKIFKSTCQNGVWFDIEFQKFTFWMVISWGIVSTRIFCSIASIPTLFIYILRTVNSWHEGSSCRVFAKLVILLYFFCKYNIEQIEINIILILRANEPKTQSEFGYQI